MVSGRRKYLLLLILCSFALSHCSDFRAVFNGKPGRPLAKSDKKNRKEHRHYTGKLGKDYFIWPLEGSVNSPYGERHGRPHDGIDIEGEEGDPFVASAAGEVVHSGSLGGYGNLIVVQHEDGLFTAYAHNQKNLVEKGDKVKKGQVIGKVGSTGHATGDHLHFEIRDQGGTYDPLDLLPQHEYAVKK